MKVYLQIFFSTIIIIAFSCTQSDDQKNDSAPIKNKAQSDTHKNQGEIEPEFFRKKREAGIDFYAAGNESFWALDMDFEKQFTFKTPDFEYNSPPVEPNLAQDAPIKRYRVETEMGEMIVTILEKRCQDTMSGQEFSHEVRVSLKTGADSSFSEYSGCGRYVPDLSLHDIWGLKEYRGLEYPNKKMPGGAHLELFPVDERMMFSDGCNSFSGSFYTDENKIYFGNMAGTLKACPNLEINSEIGSRLGMTSYSYKREGRDLIFYRDSVTVYRWRKVD